MSARPRCLRDTARSLGPTAPFVRVRPIGPLQSLPMPEPPDNPNFPIRDGRPARPAEDLGSEKIGQVSKQLIASARRLLDELHGTAAWIREQGEVDPEIFHNHRAALGRAQALIAQLP